VSQANLVGGADSDNPSHEPSDGRPLLVMYPSNGFAPLLRIAA
jgi:hypothetical protein